MGYKVKLVDEIEGPGGLFIFRRIRLVIGTSIEATNAKIPRYHYTVQVPLNEVYIRLDEAMVKAILDNNGARASFIRDINRKAKKNKVNIGFIEITAKKFDDQLIDDIVGVLLDVVYKNPFIHLYAPPRISTGNEDKDKEIFKTILDRLVDELSTHRETPNMLYFIPEYYSLREIPSLVEFYIDVFGENGCFVIDMNAKRFSSIGYSTAARIMRIVEKKYSAEDYAIYLYNHKSRKRSGGRVPSEDLLAFLSGVSFIGPTHKPARLPTSIASQLEVKHKILSKEDYLYYPVKEAPNRTEYFIYKARLGIRNDYIAVKSYNDTITNHIVQTFEDYDSINTRLLRKEKQLFLTELQKTTRLIRKYIKGESLNPFFS